eukprot:116422-Rhodomonas_salina.3
MLPPRSGCTLSCALPRVLFVHGLTNSLPMTLPYAHVRRLCDNLSARIHAAMLYLKPCTTCAKSSLPSSDMLEPGGGLRRDNVREEERGGGSSDPQLQEGRSRGGERGEEGRGEKRRVRGEKWGIEGGGGRGKKGWGR